ncbi:MAG: hypothetical protein MdMp014T_0197 [Treponematales bacterium]
MFRLNVPPRRIQVSPEFFAGHIYATNTLFGRKVVYFQDGLSRNVIEDDLRKGLPVAASMRFPERGVAGHYVLVVGMYNDNLIINDPYKNFLTGFSDGYHCVYSAEDWAAHAKGYGLRFVKDKV